MIDKNYLKHVIIGGLAVHDVESDRELTYDDAINLVEDLIDSLDLPEDYKEAAVGLDEKHVLRDKGENDE